MRYSPSTFFDNLHPQRVATNTVSAISATAMSNIVVGDPVITTYPQAHLFGLPQELRDIIFDELFPNNGLEGAAYLAPLLTSRRFYLEAVDIAWKYATFDLTKVSDERLRDICAAPQPTRKPLRLKIGCKQLKALKHTPKPFPKQLPQARVIYLTGNPNDEDKWYSYFLLLLEQHGNSFERFFSNPEAFTATAQKCIPYAQFRALAWRIHLWTSYLNVSIDELVRRCEYRTSESGERWYEIYVMDKRAGQMTPRKVICLDV